ncbi:MAG: hypothetical protein JO257_28400 [Deltaproteobacteria bacterium]|nr:hypothetical protein [Deltaproteobacteria bacterium]
MTPRRSAATIAITAFVVLVLELTSTRLYAYIGSTHATSTALSVALLGLGVGAYVALRFARARHIAAPALVAALLAVAVATIAGAPLALLAVLSLLPFAFAGMVLSAAYAARGAAAARATYAIDLLAAAAGCLLAPHLLGPLSPTQIIALLGVLAATLIDRRFIGALAAASCLALLLAAPHLPDGPLAALMRADPHSEKAIVEASGDPHDIIDSAWSPIGRLDVRRVPGDPNRLGVFTDGMSPTYMVPAHATAFEDTWGLLMSLPYRALRPERVLVLAAGAGPSVWLAMHYGARTIDAVEVSPAIPDVLARWRRFAGDVYHQPGVHFVIEDARRFLADTDTRYDLIELALALTGNGHAQPAGMEAHLYTVEAVELYLRHLTPTGTLVLIHSDPGNAYRQLLTVLAALDALGIPRARALDGIVVLRDPRPGTAYRYELLVRTSPIPLDVVDALDTAAAELLWGPGDPPERATQLLDPHQLGATAADDFSPVHDERPYFFQNTRGLIATALAQPERLWLLLGALVLALALLLERRGDARASLRPALVATALGAAFLTVELALIQRFTLAAGGALHAISFVLFSLLAWTGTGALVLGRLFRRPARGTTWACLTAALAIAATAVVARHLAWLDAIATTPLRLLLVAAVLAPAGLAIGCPFPTLLAHHGDPPDRIATLWAINGAASVAGGIAGVLALRVGGAADALLFAAALYAIAAVLAPSRG